ncbi:hypothetical protein [Wukongibacter sp. M2B1]|uniref:hypothetical protein n=1 Tax=Wukongibacter sp. M2B1 TaxID=3088895 RepID=UPI003D7BE790
MVENNLDIATKNIRDIIKEKCTLQQINCTILFKTFKEYETYVMIYTSNNGLILGKVCDLSDENSDSSLIEDISSFVVLNDVTLHPNCNFNNRIKFESMYVYVNQIVSLSPIDYEAFLSGNTHSED